jgi:hypothetical protein
MNLRLQSRRYRRPACINRRGFLRLGYWRCFFAADFGWPGWWELPRWIQPGRLYLRRAQFARGCAPGAHF